MKFTCCRCLHDYTPSSGDVDERYLLFIMCNECIDRIYDEKAAARKKTEVKSIMAKVDEVINLIKGGKCAS